MEVPISSETAPSKSSSWRSSKTLIFFTSVLSLFTENFLYGFVVPILPYMIEVRLGLDPSETQHLTTELLVILGVVSIPAAPIIGHVADKSSSRKIPLLMAVTGCSAGTLLVALTPSVWAMYVGRILQGLSGTAVWIIGFAMITDAAGAKNIGKALGFAGSFITAGIVTGPTVAGVLLELFGYWPAWSVPLVLLIMAFIARIALVDKPMPSKAETSKRTTVQNDTDPTQGENSSLLAAAGPQTATEPKTPLARGFWGLLFRQASIWASIFNIVAFAMIVSGFDATLPLHCRDAFNWNSAAIGSIFLAFQIPGMFLAPFVGWLRDRVGLRWPTTIAWALITPLLWFAGVPGLDGFLGVGAGSRGEGAFVATMIAIGIVLSFARGAGTFQLTTTLHELRASNPDAIGPGGGGSKMFSLTEMSFSTGLLLGPIMCGSLADTVGFYYTCCALAATSLSVAVSSWAFFTHKSPIREPLVEEPAAA